MVRKIRFANEKIKFTYVELRRRIVYIKDLQTGKIRKYGTDRHDSLLISEDGRTLEYSLKMHKQL